MPPSAGTVCRWMRSPWHWSDNDIPPQHPRQRANNLRAGIQVPGGPGRICKAWSLFDERAIEHDQIEVARTDLRGQKGRVRMARGESGSGGDVWGARAGRYR
eukprot:6536342-Prymnesium_polylepis.1